MKCLRSKGPRSIRPLIERLESRALLHAGVHQDDPAQLAEHMAVMNLVADQYVDLTAVQSGDWDSAATWGGRLPASGDDVLIPESVSVRLDSEEQARLHTVRVDGTLSFAQDADTRLLMDTFVVAPSGSLEIGTASQPISGSAEIVFIDNGPIDTNWDPSRFSRGLISHGSVSIHGENKTSWAYLQESPAAGAVDLVFSSAPTNWQEGDKLLVPGVVNGIDQDETRQIAALQSGGTSIQVAPLNYGHLTPAGETQIKLPVANLTRNVRFVSENAAELDRRGHIMLMHSTAVDIAFASFEDLGRTDKLVELSATNPRGRYALHVHRAMADEPVRVTGVVVDGSPGWGVVNHSSNVVVEQSVSYQVVGAGFVGEAGDETGAFRNNMAVRSNGSRLAIHYRRKIGDFGHSGHGFWLQGPGVSVENNVASGHSSVAFGIYAKGYVEPDTGVVADPASQTKPLTGFRNNMAFASMGGLEVQWSSHDLNEIKNFTAWAVGNGAVVRGAKVTVEGGVFLGTNLKGYGIQFVHGYGGTGSVYNARVQGWKVGSKAPSTGVSVYEGGTWTNNRTDFVNHADSPLELTFRNVGPASYYFDSKKQSFPGFHTTKHSVFIEEDGVRKQVYLKTQMADFVPYQEGALAGLSNRQIFDQYGLLPYGALAPHDAEDRGSYLLGAPSGLPVPIEMTSSLYAKRPEAQLTYLWNGVQHSDLVALELGWNLLLREHDGIKYTFFVYRTR